MVKKAKSFILYGPRPVECISVNYLRRQICV